MLFSLGISSGVLCVIFGLYENLVNSVLGLFQNFKKNASFLFPIVVGIGIGFFLFGKLLHYVLLSYESETKVLFLGLILGSIPALGKQAKKEKKFHLSFLFYTFLSFSVGFFLFLLETKMNPISSCFSTNFIFLFFSGFVMSCGIIIPGVSSTILLMCLGSYYVYLEAIATFNLFILVPMGLGIACGCLFFLLCIRFFLNHYRVQTYYAIIGFVLGSIFVLLPSSFSLISLFLFILSFGLACTIGDVF